MKKQKAFLENLVKSILEFVASRRVPFDLVSEASESLASHRGTVGKANLVANWLFYMFTTYSVFSLFSCLFEGCMIL